MMSLPLVLGLMSSKYVPQTLRQSENGLERRKSTFLLNTPTPTPTSSSMPTDDSDSSLHHDDLKTAFWIESKSVVKDTPKNTNMELALRGRKYSSFRRRFDSEICDKDPSLKTLFRRDNLLNANLVELLVKCGVTEEEALQQNMSVVEHSYTRRSNDDASMEEKEIALNEIDPNDELFDVDISGADTFNTIVSQIFTETENEFQRHDQWDGDAYISEVYPTSKGESYPKVRMEKTLISDKGDTHNEGDDLIMSVKTSIFQDSVDVITTEEIYRRNYNNVGGKVLSSSLQRVPGCIANVNIRLVMVPMVEDNSSYKILLDGEADALLSAGLLSTLRNVLSSSEFDASTILSVDPNDIASELNLKSVLSSGRNDGLASMWTVIQNQIKGMLSGPTNQETSSAEVRDDGAPSKPTVAMLLSGGVDSSVALNLLVNQGYDVTAFYLKIWLEDELSHLGQCPWEDDYAVCTQVCEHAGVPLEAISLQREYKERVISYTIDEARKGRTPNPDIFCNSRIKFGCFYDAIDNRNFDYVATGHYAQLLDSDDSGISRKRLLRAPDPVKDQSYFLAALKQEQLNRVLFPIGHLEKKMVRELAEEFDLPNKNRPDSQGLCFLGKVRFDEFLAAYLGNDPGDIVDAETGDIIGRHNGIWYHTVGQRKGIGKVLQPKATAKGPWYVVAKDTSKRLIIASNQYDEDVFESTRRIFYVEEVKWISGSAPKHVEEGTQINMKIRHGPKIATGSLHMEGDSGMGKIELDQKDGGLAPGQFVVFYDDMVECLGSGVISERHWMDFLSSDILKTHETV